MFLFLRYFWYLATNWNPWIALHIIRHDIRGEKKYKIATTGFDDLKKLEASGVDIDNASIYMPASYDMLEVLIKFAASKNCTHLLDLGCGKGRALCVAAHFGFSNLTGTDISKKLLNSAEQNLERTRVTLKEKISYALFHSDAFYFKIPDDCDSIFLFNPFNEIIMSGVAENIQVSLERNPRTIFILYQNPLHKELLANIGFIEIFHQQKLNYLEAIIMTNADVSAPVK